MKISMVIPTYTLNDELEEFAEVCAASYRNQVDELIISEDGGKYSDTLRKIADVYIYNRRNGGFSINVNRGWKMATGDFVAIVNSDTYLLKGDLKDLCIPGKVTSPNVITGDTGFMAGCFFVVPKEITNEHGMLLEELKMFASDSDYEWRVKDLLQRVDSVEIYHDMNKTINAAGVNTELIHKRDSELYTKLGREGKAHLPYD